MSQNFTLNPSPNTPTESVLLSLQLQEKLFVAADTGLPARHVQHWENEGLVDNTREEGQRWRRYTFVEFVWIKLVEQMRSMGIGIEVLLKVKKMLMEPVPVGNVWQAVLDDKEYLEETMARLSEPEREAAKVMFEEIKRSDQKMNYRFNTLQLLIGIVVEKRCPVSVAVFLNGDVIAIEHHRDFKLPEAEENRLIHETHGHFSISELVKDFLAGELAPSRLESMSILPENETELLRVIHSGEYKSITINFRNKKMDSLELVKSQDTTRRVVDVLAESDYQNISIVTHNGQVSKIENTVKIQLSRP
jgi:DNA-binding transcriptional MerR regulator